MAQSLVVQSPMESSSGFPSWMLAKGAERLLDKDETQTARQVWGLLQKGKHWREHWSKHWDRFWMLWEGEQWRRQRPQSLHQSVVNEVFSVVETFTGHVSEALPPVKAQPRNAEHRAVAELLTKMLLYVDDQNAGAQELAHAIRSAAVTGCGWIRVDWDDTRLRGKGDVSYRAVDEKFVFVSPNARTLDEAFFVVEARNVPREYVERTWERGKEVPPGVWDGSLTNVRVTGGVDRLWETAAAFTTTDGSQTQQTFAAGQSSKQQKDLVTLLEAWIRQEDGEMAYVVVANGVVLQDGLSPYRDNRFPYVNINLIPTLDSVYGRSLVQFIERLQDELNFLHSYSLDYLEFAANNPLVVDIENIQEGEVITNEPGAILVNRSQRGAGFYPLQMPGPSPAWLNAQQQVQSLMDEVLGRVDVLKGERPAGVTTLGGLEIIREQANVRLARMTRWVVAAKRRLSELVISRITQFLRDERVMRVVGPLGQEGYVEVNKPVGYDAGGEQQREHEIPADAEFDVEVGVERPGAKQAQVELAIALAKTPAHDGLPMVDRQYVLETAIEDSAAIGEVMSRMDKLAQAQAAAAAKAQGGPGAEPEDIGAKAMAVLKGF